MNFLFLTFEIRSIINLLHRPRFIKIEQEVYKIKRTDHKRGCRFIKGYCTSLSWYVYSFNMQTIPGWHSVAPSPSFSSFLFNCTGNENVTMRRNIRCPAFTALFLKALFFTPFFQPLTVLFSVSTTLSCSK